MDNCGDRFLATIHTVSIRNKSASVAAEEARRKVHKKCENVAPTKWKTETKAVLGEQFGFLSKLIGIFNQI